MEFSKKWKEEERESQKIFYFFKKGNRILFLKRNQNIRYSDKRYKRLKFKKKGKRDKNKNKKSWKQKENMRGFGFFKVSTINIITIFH